MDRPLPIFAWSSLWRSARSAASACGRAVALPAVQAEFGIDRADASLPYTAVMLGFVVGGPADRAGSRTMGSRSGRDRRDLLGIGFV